MSAATSPPTADECCHPAPAVLEFDQAGALVSHWGGPGAATSGRDRRVASRSSAGQRLDRRRPASPRPLARADAGAAPAPPRPEDAHVLKFSREGKFLLQIGQAGKTGGNDSKTGLNRPTAIAVDPAANEVYVADGVGNRRVVVFDADTGAYKRHWGAYGKRPRTTPTRRRTIRTRQPSKQFRNRDCVEMSADGLVYVCDRRNNRIQVFRKDGTFVKEALVVEGRRSATGSVWDVALLERSAAAVHLRRRRAGPEGVRPRPRHARGRVELRRRRAVAGRILGVGSVAIDSKGNVYTRGELRGQAPAEVRQ